MTTVTVPRKEYLRLKNLEVRFGKLLDYLESVLETKQARKEIAQKKVISQEKLFKKLGL
ncbi:MAG: hypothetical protein AAB646_00830 [Patescibacteria group bacterium]